MTKKKSETFFVTIFSLFLTPKTLLSTGLVGISSGQHGISIREDQGWRRRRRRLFFVAGVFDTKKRFDNNNVLSNNEEE